MTQERDTALEALFDRAKAELPGDAFTGRVVGRIDCLRRGVIAGWLVAILLVVAILWVISGPLIQAVDILVDFLPRSWLDIDQRIAAIVLAPVNSFAALLALPVLLFWYLLKKRF